MSTKTASGRAAEKGIAMSTWDEPARPQPESRVAQATWDEPGHDFVSHMMAPAPVAAPQDSKLPDSEQRFFDAFKRGLARHEQKRAEAAELASPKGTAFLNKVGSQRRPGDAGDAFWGRLNKAAPGGRMQVIAEEMQRLKGDTARHAETMRSLADQNQRDGAARRMQGLEDFERNTLGYVVPPSGQEMAGSPAPAQGRRPDEPVYDAMGRPSLRGQPAAPSAKVARGPGEIVSYKTRGPDGELIDETPSAKEERIRRGLAGRIITEHQIGPDGAALLRDPRLTTLRGLIDYKKSLREDEEARRRAAVQDRWASFHMGNDALGLGYRNMPLARAQGMYMRSLARAAGEQDPLAMTAVNQAHGNHIAASQSAGIAANRDRLAHEREVNAMNAQMIRDQRQQDTPSGQNALLDEAERRALALPEDQRRGAVEQVMKLRGLGATAPKAAQERIAMHEAGRGNVQHGDVFEVLKGIPSEGDRMRWLMTYWRPNGQAPTRDQAHAVIVKMRTPYEAVTNGTVDAAEKLAKRLMGY